MKLVENYIIIQHLRFGDTFKYIIPPKSILDKYLDLEIIVMQLQIHVENAIEHGIRNRESATYVKIDINETEFAYEIVVEDDGIGRVEAKKIKSRGFQTGVKMLNELHNVYNSYDFNKHKISSKYQDEIFLENGIKYGTRVIISIPKDFVYKID